MTDHKDSIAERCDLVQDGQRCARTKGHDGPHECLVSDGMRVAAMTHEGPERRSSPRAEAVGIEAIVLARHNAAVPFTIETLSITGALLVGTLSVVVNDRIQVLFEVDGRPVELSAEVVHADHLDILTDRIAVRFVDVPAETRDALERLVAVLIEHNAERSS